MASASAPPPRQRFTMAPFGSPLLPLAQQRPKLIILIYYPEFILIQSKPVANLINERHVDFRLNHRGLLTIRPCYKFYLTTETVMTQSVSAKFLQSLLASPVLLFPIPYNFQLMQIHLLPLRSVFIQMSQNYQTSRDLTEINILSLTVI